MSLTERVTEDYQNWDQEEGTWEIVPDSSATGWSGIDDSGMYNYIIKKSFVAAAAARESALTVEAEGHEADPGQQYGGAYTKGECEVTVNLIDADSVSHELFNQTGSFGQQDILDALDLNSYITKAGTYYLEFVVAVKSSVESTIDDDFYEQSYARFENVSLMLNDTVVAYEIEFDEFVDREDMLVMGITLEEFVDRAEYFTIIKTTPLVSKDEKLLAAKSDSKVYDFEQGEAEGRFDTKDEDFGLPGVDKTLSLVTFTSPAEAPHTVSVWVSMDSGLTWIEYGQATISKGTTGIIGVWETKEQFRVSFRGAGLQLDTFSLYAIPRGPERPTEEEEEE